MEECVGEIVKSLRAMRGIRVYSFGSDEHIEYYQLKCNIKK